MEEYLGRFEKNRSRRPPRDALVYAAGNEFFSPEMHLAYNAAPYIFAGEHIRTLAESPVRLLELGCGTGFETSYLKERFAPGTSITGIDRVPGLVRYAAENYSRPGLRFLTADAGGLPFADGSFGMVIGIYSIIHTMTRRDAGSCLAETIRVLKPGGTLIFTTPNRKLSHDVYHENPDNDPDLFICHLLRREYDREELRALLSPFLGDAGACFEELSIDCLANESFRPVIGEVLGAMARKRFREERGEAPIPRFLRRTLPQGIKARYFFRMVRKSCRRRGLSLRDIALGTRLHPEGAGAEADHFFVTARKAGKKGS